MFGAHHIPALRLVRLHRRALRHHHHLLQLQRLLPETEIQRRREIRSHDHLLLGRRMVAHHRRRGLIHVGVHRNDHVEPIRIRRRPPLGALKHHAGPRQRISLLVHHSAHHLPGRPCRSYTAQRQNSAQRKHSSQTYLQLVHLFLLTLRVIESHSPRNTKF